MFNSSKYNILSTSMNEQNNIKGLPWARKYILGGILAEFQANFRKNLGEFSIFQEYFRSISTFFEHKKVLKRRRKKMEKKPKA